MASYEAAFGLQAPRADKARTKAFPVRGERSKYNTRINNA